MPRPRAARPVKRARKPVRRKATRRKAVTASPASGRRTLSPYTGHYVKRRNLTRQRNEFFHRSGLPTATPGVPLTIDQQLAIERLRRALVTRTDLSEADVQAALDELTKAKQLESAAEASRVTAVDRAHKDELAIFGSEARAKKKAKKSKKRADNARGREKERERTVKFNKKVVKTRKKKHTRQRKMLTNLPPP